jgi:hypothetical protein
MNMFSARILWQRQKEIVTSKESSNTEKREPQAMGWKADTGTICKLEPHCPNSGISVEWNGGD